MLDREACSLVMYRVLVPDILAGGYVGFGMSLRRLAYLCVSTCTCMRCVLLRVRFAGSVFVFASEV